LKLKQIGRHYFDPSRPVAVPAHFVELWPGYFTAVNPNEKGTMLVADITHKVLRTDTVYDQLQELERIYKANYREMAEKQLLSQIVLTRYKHHFHLLLLVL
jgi:aubergine-like protein